MAAEAILTVVAPAEEAELQVPVDPPPTRTGCAVTPPRPQAFPKNSRSGLPGHWPGLVQVLVRFGDPLQLKLVISSGSLWLHCTRNTPVVTDRGAAPVTVKVLLLDAVPPGVVTLIGPLPAPTGTVVVILVDEATV